MRLLYDPATPLLDMYSKELESVTRERQALSLYHSIIRCSLRSGSNPCISEWVDEKSTRCMHTVEYYAAL